LILINKSSPPSLEATAGRQKFEMVRQCNIDPKPDELALGRVKVRESELEARTGWLFKTFG